MNAHDCNRKAHKEYGLDHGLEAAHAGARLRCIWHMKPDLESWMSFAFHLASL